MTYVNLVFHAGYQRFAAEAVAAGVSRRDPARTSDGGAGGVGAVRGATPGSRPCCSRRRSRPTSGSAALCERSQGFVYGVNLLGVTGERTELADSSTVLAKRLKAHHRPAR